jgi:hypothetical protein
MPTSGGIAASIAVASTRKLRWALEGRGKRGGARVIYYYHGEAMPLFALPRTSGRTLTKPTATTSAA